MRLALPSRPILRAAAVLAAMVGVQGCLLDLDGLSGGTAAPADAGPESAADAPAGDSNIPDTQAQDTIPDRAVSCPATAGAEGVAVIAGEFAFCIDRTEVTNEAYAAFLSSPVLSDVLDAQPPACAWNVDFAPSQGWPPNQGAEQLPVTFVDWCDARAYCAWAGKRLCGAAAGGPLLPQFVGSPGIDQWYQACSAGGTRAFPYGQQYQDGACNVGGDPLAPHFVGEHALCVGGLPELFDMSGNVWEWIDSCSPSGGDAGPDDVCSTRGGAYDSVPPDEVACAFASRASPRSSAWLNVGFRCCADVP